MFSRTLLRRFTTSSASATPPDISRIVFSSADAAGGRATPDAALLAAALDHVPQHGFTTAALRAAAAARGLSPMAAGVAARGGAELAEHFVAAATRALPAAVAAAHPDWAALRVPQKIRAAVLLRLDMLKPLVRHWPDALALMAHPQNAPYALKNLAQLVDEIWYITGDRSTDMNWYSKRALLAGVYTSTELFMTQDKSPDFVETAKFLDRRLQDVGFIGRTSDSVSKMVDFGVKSAFGVLASKGFIR
ncbi:COQ9-domain-containing protein [Obelidium mucronatum]|nr:COQ9-domain-containing protein [Obelidium mucronatum]